MTWLIPTAVIAVWLGLQALWFGCGLWWVYGPGSKRRRHERPRLYVVRTP